MSIGRIHSLYKVNLLGMDNIESQARRDIVLCMLQSHWHIFQTHQSRELDCIFHPFNLTPLWYHEKSYVNSTMGSI